MVFAMQKHRQRCHFQHISNSNASYTVEMNACLLRLLHYNCIRWTGSKIPLQMKDLVADCKVLVPAR